MIFKTEANKDIGSGHFVRSLTLAEEFVKKNINVLFLFTNTEEHYRQLLMQKSFEYNIISLSEATNADYYKALTKKLNTNNFCIIFDTDDLLYTKESFQISLRENEIPFMYITVNDKEIYHSNILLCQNIIAFKQNYHTDTDTVKFLGPKYFIYKPEYRNNNKLKHKDLNPANITCLICFGGADKKNLSLQTAKLISNAGISGLTMNIVMGASYRYLEEIKIWAYSNKNIRLYHNTSEMYNIIKSSDLAITSGGLTLWEAAVLNKPIIAIATSEREEEPLKYLEELNYIIYLGIAEQWNEKLLLSCLANLKDEYKKFQHKADKFKQEINPDGVSLVVESVIKTIEWKKFL